MSVCIHRDVYDMCCDEGVLSDVVGCRRPSFCVDVVVDRSPVLVFPSSRDDHATRARGIALAAAMSIWHIMCPRAGIIKLVGLAVITT